MINAFSALTLLAGRQVKHPACKNWVAGCWHGYLSGARQIIIFELFKIKRRTFYGTQLITQINYDGNHPLDSSCSWLTVDLLWLLILTLLKPSTVSVILNFVINCLHMVLAATCTNYLKIFSLIDHSAPGVIGPWNSIPANDVHLKSLNSFKLS